MVEVVEVRIVDSLLRIEVVEVVELIMLVLDELLRNDMQERLMYDE